MSIILQKGSGYNAEYASTDFPTLSDDWTGSVSLYVNYPGTATFTKALTRSGNKMLLALTAGEITALLDGTYYFVTTIANTVLGVTITSVNYATVLAINVSAATMCKLFGTIEKGDGTPAGSPTTSMINTDAGVMMTTSWKGVEVRATLPAADSDSGKIVGVESWSTTTNAVGYFELYVIQGMTVVVSCPSFGTAVTVVTTGLTEKDLSTYF